MRCQTLAEENIISAPVWDDVQGKYVGFFELLDIIKPLSGAFNDPEKKHEACELDESKACRLAMRSIERFSGTVSRRSCLNS